MEIRVIPFQRLIVWQKAHSLALTLYKETANFPKEERYGMISQLRRAAISTAANIVEGSRRRTKMDFCHFLTMAQGSNEEVKYFLLLAQDLGFLGEERARELQKLAEQISAMIHRFGNSLTDHPAP